MFGLPFLSYAWISLGRGNFVVKSQQAILPLPLRACRDKSGLGVVIHQRIWKRPGYTSPGNVGQPGSFPIFTLLLKVEDEKHTVIRVFKSYPIVIEGIGSKLMRITRQVIKENHRHLVPMCLHVI
jgi:hypothetical protein